MSGCATHCSADSPAAADGHFAAQRTAWLLREELPLVPRVLQARVIDMLSTPSATSARMGARATRHMIDSFLAEVR